MGEDNITYKSLSYNHLWIYNLDSIEQTRTCLSYNVQVFLMSYELHLAVVLIIINIIFKPNKCNSHPT